MKKIISIILALTMCLSAAALLASCAGESAYEIAVRNGFTGTEEEWLKSLQGDKGDKGDNGATGAQGEKGDKGDTGATGIQGEKGETGEKGDTGAAGSNGSNGSNGEAGAAGRKVELQVKDGYIQWRYEGDSTWQNLVSLESITGPQGDKGDQGAQGEKGDAPYIKDGLWWIGDTPTNYCPGNLVGGEGEGEGTVQIVKCSDIKFIEGECAIWKGGDTPSLQIEYTLVDEEGNFIRTGITNVTKSMIVSDTVFNGADTYENVTVKFLGFEKTIEVLEINTTYELVKTVFTRDTTPVYQIKKTVKTADGVDEDIIDVTADMIVANNVDASKAGKYSITVSYFGLPCTVEITIEEMMVYFEDFNDDSYASKTNSALLEALGFRYGDKVAESAFDLKISDGKFWYNGLGKLYNSIVLVDNNKMALAGEYGYTVQFDLTKLDHSQKYTMTVSPKYEEWLGDDQTDHKSNVTGVVFAQTSMHLWYRQQIKDNAVITTVSHYDDSKWQTSNNENLPEGFAGATSTKNFSSVLQRLGLQSVCGEKVVSGCTTATHIAGTELTIKMIVDEAYGLRVYIKGAEQPDSAFVLAMTTKLESDDAKTMLSWADALVISGTKGTFSIDNIAIWTGTERPSTNDTSVYESLIG